MQVVFSKEEQKSLRINMAIRRLNRKGLADVTGVSMPTLKKLLDGDCPIVITQRTAISIKHWQATK